MTGSPYARFGLKCTIWTLGVLGAMISVLVIFAALVDAGHFQGPILRFVAAHTARQIRIAGPLKVELLSFYPSVSAEAVVIGNPAWMPPGTTAQIGRLTLVFDLPMPGRSFGIARLEMVSASLDLVRDSAGRANWQWFNPDERSRGGMPIVQSLTMNNAHVRLDDARRHLQFEGTVSAGDVSESAIGSITPLAAAPPLEPPRNGQIASEDRPGPHPSIARPTVHSFRIEGAGRLNGQPNSFQIDGDPLSTASHARPYGFTYLERSSGSRLSGRGSLPRPFNFNALDTTFEASGADLKDLYFLTGVTLPNTNAYRLSGKLSRRGKSFRYSDLNVTTGRSDMSGTVSIESSKDRAQIDADLYSEMLRSSDLGARAAGRESTPVKPLLFPDTVITFSSMGRSDAIVNFHARGAEVGRVPLHEVAARLTIERGVLKVAPLSATMLDGKLTVYLTLDATTAIPAENLDLRIANLQLGRIDREALGQPPFEGLLSARISAAGHGSSIHQFAASADGTVTMVVPRGQIRASLAELSGIDLRGLGLMLEKNKKDTPLRCGVASFTAHDGTLNAQTMVVDTEPVLITGNGTIHLESEVLDLSFRGKPKSWRLLRVRAPVAIRGTLLHPLIGMKVGNTLAHSGEAVALGVLLIPLGAVLAFVDPSLAKDADCIALLEANRNAAGRGAPRLPTHSPLQP